MFCYCALVLTIVQQDLFSKRKMNVCQVGNFMNDYSDTSGIEPAVTMIALC